MTNQPTTKGGQGRSSREVDESAAVTVCCLIGAAIILIILSL